MARWPCVAASEPRPSTTHSAPPTRATRSTCASDAFTLLEQLSLDEWITYITGLGEEKATKVLQLYENAATKGCGGPERCLVVYLRLGDAQTGPEVKERVLHLEFHSRNLSIQELQTLIAQERQRHTWHEEFGLPLDGIVVIERLGTNT